MQRKIVSIVVGSFLATNIVLAQGVNVNVDANVNANLGAGKVKAEATTTANTTTSLDISGNATSSVKKNEKATTTVTASPSTTTVQSKRSTTAETHMSVVAKFVQSLQAIADRQGGIGAQVRAVAQAQNDTATTTVTAMTNIEARGKVRTFFFGADNKSIGQLRSDLVVTENNINQLKTFVEKATTLADKAELAAQIKVLEDTQAQLNAYVKLHENVFSLFGWFNK